MRKLGFKRKDLFSTLKLDQKQQQQQEQQLPQQCVEGFPTPPQKGPNKLNHAEVDLERKLELFQVINLLTTFQRI